MQNYYGCRVETLWRSILEAAQAGKRKDRRCPRRCVYNYLLDSVVLIIGQPCHYHSMEALDFGLSQSKPISVINSVLGHIEGINSYVRAEFAIKTLENFIASADQSILSDHVPLSHKVTSRVRRYTHLFVPHWINWDYSSWRVGVVCVCVSPLFSSFMMVVLLNYLS